MTAWQWTTKLDSSLIQNIFQGTLPTCSLTYSSCNKTTQNYINYSCWWSKIRACTSYTSYKSQLQHTKQPSTVGLHKTSILALYYNAIHSFVFFQKILGSLCIDCWVQLRNWKCVGNVSICRLHYLLYLAKENAINQSVWYYHVVITGKK